MFYAQLNEDNICYCVSTYNTGIPAEFEHIGMKYDGENFIEVEKTPSELRKSAYENMTKKEDDTPLLLFHEREYTVNDAIVEYRAYYEGLAPDANEFKTKINAARTYIRELYPEV